MFCILDIVDSSGIRIIYTPTLRKHDAASLLIGESTNRLQIIPPFEKDFLDQGFCSEECLRKVSLNIYVSILGHHDGCSAYKVFCLNMWIRDSNPGIGLTKT